MICPQNMKLEKGLLRKNFLVHIEEERMSGYFGLDESVCNVSI